MWNKTQLGSGCASFAEAKELCQQEDMQAGGLRACSRLRALEFGYLRLLNQDP